MEYIGKTKEEIRAEMKADFRKQTDKFDDATLDDIVKKMTPWCECPIQEGKQINPLSCNFCLYGQMTKCNYPNDRFQHDNGAEI